MDLSKIVQHAGLGRILYSAEAVSGGLMHKMYRAETEKGTFALKMLNPEIMRRPTALKNINAAEKAAHACEGKLPVIAAMMINGRQVQCFENQYYMVFPWFDGKSIFPPHIQETHCCNNNNYYYSNNDLLKADSKSKYDIKYKYGKSITKLDGLKVYNLKSLKK